MPSTYQLMINAAKRVFVHDGIMKIFTFMKWNQYIGYGIAILVKLIEIIIIGIAPSYIIDRELKFSGKTMNILIYIIQYSCNQLLHHSHGECVV